MQAPEENILVNEGSEAVLPDESGSNSIHGDISAASPASQPHTMEDTELGCGASELVRGGQESSLEHPGENGKGKIECGNNTSVLPRQNIVLWQSREASSNVCLLDSTKVLKPLAFFEILCLFLARKASVLK